MEIKDLISKEHIDENGYWISPIDGSQMILVEGSSFIMGSEDKISYQDEKPTHEVYLEPFFIDIHKVTKENYQKFLTELEKHGGHHKAWCHPDEDKAKSHIPTNWDKQLKSPKNYVCDITWYDAWCYARWAGKDLPTEAQWEKASYGKYLRIINGKGTNSNICVGKGYEWCLDWYKSNFYNESPQSEPLCNEKGVYKVARGNFYHSVLPLKRNTFRFRYSPDDSDETIHFRCVKTLASLRRDQEKKKEQDKYTIDLNNQKAQETAERLSLSNELELEKDDSCELEDIKEHFDKKIQEEPNLETPVTSQDIEDIKDIIENSEHNTGAVDEIKKKNHSWKKESQDAQDIGLDIIVKEEESDAELEIDIKTNENKEDTTLDTNKKQENSDMNGSSQTEES